MTQKSIVFWRSMLSAILLLNSQPIHSQPISKSEIFNQITNESGRSLGFITGIQQDDKGFLWFGTRNGLFKYDGYHFTSYRKSLQNPWGLPFSDITLIYPDNLNFLWVRHFDRFYLLEKERISNRFAPVLSQRFSHNTQIIQDKDDNYWIGPHNKYLFRFNPKSSQFDSISLVSNIWPETLIDSAKKISPKIYYLKLNPQDINKDTTLTFSLSEAKTFLVISAGEGNQYKFFDFGTIKRNQTTFWQPNFSKAILDIKSQYFFTAVDLVTLSPGYYSLNYCSDGTNLFNPNEINPSTLQFYGIALVEVSNPEKIRKELQNPKLKPGFVQGDIIYHLTTNNKGYPLLSTNKGIFEYNPSENTFINRFPLEIPDLVQSQTNIPIIQTKNNTTIFAVNETLYLINGKQIKSISLKSKGTLTLSLLCDSDNLLWIGTNNGIFICDLNNIKPEISIHFKCSTTNRLYSDMIWTLFEDRSRNIWIGTDKGLNQFVKSKFRFIDLQNERFSPQPMISDEKNKIYLLTKKGFWVKVGENFTESKPVDPKYFNYFKLTNEHIYDFHDLLYDSTEKQVYFTTAARVGKMDLNANVVKTVELAPLEIKVPNIATKLVKTQKYFLVAGIDRLMMFSKDLVPQGEVRYFHSPEASFDVTKSLIKDLVKINNNLVALRTEYAIYVIDVDQRKIIFELPAPEEIVGTSLTNGNLAIDSLQSLWFAIPPTIYELNNDSKLNKYILHFEEDLGDVRISFNGKSMYLATNNGLFLFDNYTNLHNHINDTLPHNLYRYFSTLDGLAHSQITGVIPTQSGKIWLTTLKGMTHLDPENNLIKNYFREDDYITMGFPGNYLITKSNSTKTCVLQTTNGLLVFKPDSINPYSPNVVVTEIALFGKPLETDSLPWEKKYLKLKYNQNFLTFTFASLDFTQPASNRYRYRMLKFNSEWTYTDATNRKAPFTGIPPGKYIFEVQGTNNDGVWSSTGKQIIIEITPPWYKTILAYILYVVFTVLGIIGYIKWRERKLIEEKRILEEMVRARTAEIVKQKEEIQAQRDKIAEQNKNITDSINYASRIQAALLPQREMLDKYLCSYFVLWRPRDIVSGDFFWMTHHNDISIAVAADCTGHGVPGAFMSMLGIAFLNDLVNKEKIFETDQILNELRNNIMVALKQTGEEGGSKDGMDISMCAINHRTLQAKFSGAYNPLLIVRNNECLEFKADKMPIGVHIKKDEKFTQHKIDLQIGDRLYMFSDGYVDQFGGEDGRKFMSKRFKEILVNSRRLTMPEQKEFLNKTIEEWMGHREQIDDILVFGIEITEKIVLGNFTESYPEQKNVNDM